METYYAVFKSLGLCYLKKNHWRCAYIFNLQQLLQQKKTVGKCTTFTTTKS